MKPEWEYKISVIGKDDFLGTITYFEKKFQTTEINNNTELEQTPTLDIKDVTISGANTLEITYDFDAKNYNSENINNLLFNISYGDNNNQIVEISYDELVLGKKTLNISENISSITINSSFIFTNNQILKEIVSEEKVFELNNNFEIKYSIDTYNQYIKLSPIGIFENETYIVVSTSENTESVPYNLFYDIFIPYENSGEITLNYYLSNESGEILSDEQTITVDTTFERVNYNL